MEWPKVILFGDSLTQKCFEPVHGYWGAKLAFSLARVCDVVNRGFSGYTSRSGRKIFPKIFSSENLKNVKAFVIFFGTNDNGGGPEGAPGYVPIEEYEANLEYFINSLEELGVQKDKIILMTVGPYYEETFLKMCQEWGRTFPSRDNAIVAKYAEACLKVGQKNNVETINLYDEFMKVENWQELLLDGVHLSSKGSDLVFEHLWPQINKRTEPESSVIMPHWSEICAKEE